MQQFSLVYNNLCFFLEPVDEPRPTYDCGQLMQGSSSEDKVRVFYTIKMEFQFLQCIHTCSEFYSCIQLMQSFHWNRQAGNYAFLESRDRCLHGRLGSVSSSRPVWESVKYQTCFMFLRPLLTLISDPNFNPLATGL